MALTPWDRTGGRDPYRTLRSAVDRLFNGFAQEYRGWEASGTAVWPPVNVREEKDAFILEAEVPGLQMDAIEITSQGRDLTLRGERQDPGAAPETYQRRERFMGSFIRFVTLPADIEADRARAVLTDGILQVSVPKSESAKPRRIDVKPSARTPEPPQEPPTTMTGGQPPAKDTVPGKEGD